MTFVTQHRTESGSVGLNDDGSAELNDGSAELNDG